MGDLLTNVKDGFKGIIDWFKDFPTMLGKLFDKWFNPNSDQLEGEFDIGSLFEQRLTFVQQFKTALSNISRVGQPLQLPVVQLGSWKIDINGKFFEAAVPKIRSGIATLFWVMCALSVWRMISGVFNIHVGNVAGSIAQDNKYFGGRD